ncbi:MAG: PDZ domain-containing protein, partial [Clostridia bacterium]|nr:PDZ domain-containing protein [Clostridia bacterium]
MISSSVFLGGREVKGMSVEIKSVDEKSPADKSGIRAGEILLSIDGNEIMDVLDYRFYQNNSRLTVKISDVKG